MLKHVESFEELQEEIKGKKVLVDFFATWCGPCRMLSPILEELGKDPSVDFDIVKVDVDEVEEAAMHYHIATIPTLMLFKEGKLVDRISTFMRKDQVIDFCNK